MDPDLKQRIIGAVVITALAAIFIPMLFDDPVDDSGRTVSELVIPPAPGINQDSPVQPPPGSVDAVLSSAEDAALKSARQGLGTATGADARQPSFVRWVIQIGSFSERKNADSLRDRLKEQGFKAFVDSVEIPGKGTLYRVRVGPELDKPRAESIRDKIDALNQIHSIVVSEQAK